MTTGTNYVFTSNSLQICLVSGKSDFDAPEMLQSGEHGVVAVDLGGCRFFIHRRDERNSPRIILASQNGTPLSPVPPELWRATLERIHRIALESAQPPLRLPAAWSAYHYQNLLAFFANPHGLGAKSLRWVAELRPEGSRDVCFWKLTMPEREIQLRSFEPPRDLYRKIVEWWPEAISAAKERFRQIPISVETTALQPTIDLEAVSFGAVTRYRNYSTWMDSGLLTPGQRKFILWPPEQSVKLQGPAGSGKTIALELKALRELYEARRKGQNIRILFATHSWALAEQVDSALRGLDESRDISAIDVFPLLEISRVILPTERRSGPEFRMLGEDSLTGKRLQLARIDEVLNGLVKSDWLAYRSGASADFRARLESPRGSPERNAVVWDLMVEFYSVLSAHGILPGVAAERRYLRLPRSSWMMPLVSDSDKRFVVRVYTEYIAGLKREQLLTADQLVNDFLNYLETFAWDLRRERDGYDLIFVDELHLFGEQERLVLHYLTRSAAQFPKMFMALDPAQAPGEVYSDFPMAKAAPGGSGEADLELGTVESVKIGKIHRFTPEILELVKHMQHQYPALDLWQGWGTYGESVESGAEHGAKPVVYQHESRAEEIAAIAQRVELLMGATGGGHRVAVVLIDELQLEVYENSLTLGGGLRLVVIESRDDVDKLQYARRSVVLGAAEYLAGLQFDAVIIGAVPDARTGVANLGYQRRRLLRLLYLAVTRATRHVEIHINDEAGEMPEIVETALVSAVAVSGDPA